MSDGEIEQNEGNIWYQKIGYTDTVKCEENQPDFLIAESQDALATDEEVKYVIKTDEQVKEPCIVE